MIRAVTAADEAAFTAAARASRKLHRRWVQPPADAEAFGRYVDRHASINRVSPSSASSIGVATPSC